LTGGFGILSNPEQFNPIRTDPFACEIFSDASLSGWGVSCNHREWWSEEDKMKHINLLELKAFFYAPQCFATNIQNCQILLRINNTTAISCINRFIQYPHLLKLARQIWFWCENRNIMIFVSYISSIDNSIADYESIYNIYI